MNTLQRGRAEELFLELVSMPSDSWPALLDSRCAGDNELRNEVASLLGCHQDAGSFLDRQELLALTPDLIRPIEPPLPAGTKVGEYTIERVIGSGGMGVVYQARQERPRRVVALKLVNSSIASRALLRRFEHEAEMLGRLQHPGIAQIFEAGAADAGEGAPRRPFIAMELVDGPSLLEYARSRGLSTRERIELMVRVCDAMQHAHQRGVIHRDLKPANILVDPTGQPKILDFGVARAVAADLQMTTQHTTVGQLIGTLPYMSPEQVLGQPNEVDTRSDVYALGVILFEMLAGRQPHDLANRSIPDAVSIIRNDDPARLSSIDRVFRGDLEVIVGTALDKDKTRRYQSAAALGADLAHHLAGEPITAKVDSAFYVLRKQIKRHRGPVAVGVVALVGLIAFAIFASVQSHRNSRLAASERAARVEADTARDLARDNSEQLRRNLYVSAIGFAQAAQSLNDIDRLKRVLDSCPEDLRGWEWNFLRSSADTSSRIMPEWDGREHFAFAGNGSRILRFYSVAPILILDGATGRPLREVDLGGDWISHCILSYDGRTALVGTSEGVLIVIDVETGSMRRLNMPNPLPVHPQAIWADGSRAMVVLQMTMATLQAFAVDLRDGRIMWEAPVHGLHMLAAVSPDGRHVAVGDYEGRVDLFDADGCAIGEPVRTRGWVRGLKFSPDSTRLAVGGNEGAVYIRDVATGNIARHRVFDNKIWTLAWSPDGRTIAAAGTEGYIRIVEADTGRLLATQVGHSSTVHSIAWAASGDWVVSGSLDKTIRWWDRPERPAQPVFTLEGGVSCGTWARDGESVFLGGNRGGVVQVDANTMTLRREIARVDDICNFVTVSPDGSLLAVCWNKGEVVMFDTATWREIRRFGAPSGRAICADFSPDGSALALGSDHPSITVWNPRTGEMISEFPGHTAFAIRARYSPDGKLIAAGYYDGLIRLHDAVSGRVVRECVGATDWTMQPRFTPDGTRLVASSVDSKIYIWDLRSEAPPTTMVGHQFGVHAGAVSPDGRRYLSGGWDNTIRLWDLESEQELLTWRPHINANWVAEFSPDGKRFLSASHDGTALMWSSEPRR